MTASVAGVDGCRAGWVCVLRRTEPPFEEQIFLARHFDEILSHPAKPCVIAVDIPIGFPERITGAGRECDRSARKVLGPRAPSVFAPPARAVLSETDYRAACAAALATSDPPRQISKQMFHLFAKVREVDRAIAPEAPVFECHPEAAFWAMNGRAPLAEPKKRRNKPHKTGLETRLALLVSCGFSETFLREAGFPSGQAGYDDILDACACSWTPALVPGPPPAFSVARRSPFRRKSQSTRRAFAWRSSHSEAHSQPRPRREPVRALGFIPERRIGAAADLMETAMNGIVMPRELIMIPLLAFSFLGLVGAVRVIDAKAFAAGRETRSSLPNLNIEAGCQDAANNALNKTTNYSGCMSKEHTARAQLGKEWASYSEDMQGECLHLVTPPALPSYVTLQECLKMARDARAMSKSTGADEIGRTMQAPTRN